MIGAPAWHTVPVDLSSRDTRLADLDSALCAKFGGTQYEFRVSDGPLGARGRPLFIEARRVPIQEHAHTWSLPIDELRGRRVCLFPGCGHIATRSEMFDVFLASKARARTEGRA